MKMKYLVCRNGMNWFKGSFSRIEAEKIAARERKRHPEFEWTIRVKKTFQDAT